MLLNAVEYTIRISQKKSWCFVHTNQLNSGPGMYSFERSRDLSVAKMRFHDKHWSIVTQLYHNDYQLVCLRCFQSILGFLGIF